MNVVDQALDFACVKHRGQYRKTGDFIKVPYIVHPLDVARLLIECGFSSENDQDLIAAALLHDILEDCDVKHQELQERFGNVIANTVQELTFLGSSPEEKAAYLNSFATSSLGALIIKVADRICNVEDYRRSNPGYAQKYFRKGRPIFQAYEDRHDKNCEPEKKLFYHYCYLEGKM